MGYRVAEPDDVSGVGVDRSVGDRRLSADLAVRSRGIIRRARLEKPTAIRSVCDCDTTRTEAHGEARACRSSSPTPASKPRTRPAWTCARSTASIRARTSQSSREATMLYIHPEECIDCGACVPACPGRRDLREHRRDAVASERPDRGQRDLPPRRRRRDGQGRSDRQGARRGARRHHGGSGGRAAGGARPASEIADCSIADCRLSD